MASETVPASASASHPSPAAPSPGSPSPASRRRGPNRGASEARERLLQTAAGLFYREGIHTVGVDRIVDEAGVTRATFYRHFPGKEELVGAYLDLEDLGIRTLFAEAAAHESDPHRLVDLVIEGIADDVARRHTRGCPFINAAAEFPDPDSRIRRTVSEHRDWFRRTLAQLLRDADVTEPDLVAGQLVLLRDAAMVGGYLDGWPNVRDAFRAAAQRAVSSS